MINDKPPRQALGELAFARPAVDAIRAEIERWWEPRLRLLGIERNWSWMGLPDRVAEMLEPDDVQEWRDLQDRYQWEDATK